jgi:hypothetical protein
LETLTAGLGIPGWRFAAASLGFQACMEAGAFARADLLLDRMSHLAQRMDNPMVSCYLHVRQCIRCAVAGRFEDAAAHAEKMREHGEVGGLAESQLYYIGAQWMIGYHVGRLADLEPVFAAASADVRPRPVIRPALAAIYAELGDTKSCASTLEEVGRTGESPDDQDELVTAAVTAIAARAVGDTRCADLALRTLERFGDQLIDNGSTHFGSTLHYRALATATLGRPDDAASLFGRAVERHAELGNHPMEARSRLEAAHLRLEDSRSDLDRDDALRALERVRSHCVRRGLIGTVDAVDRVVADR